MVKTLKKHGNSLALIIDRPVLDLLNISGKTPLKVTTDGQVLIISPIRDKAHAKKFDAALLGANAKYGKILKRLAE